MKYLYTSLLSIPMIMFINTLSLSNSIKADLSLITLTLFMFVFTRGFLSNQDEREKVVLELIFISFLGILFSTSVISFIYLILLYLVALLFNKRHILSSKVYLNYLIFFSIIPYIIASYDKLDNLYMIGIVLLLIINQVLYMFLYEKRNIIFEIFHSIISMILIISLVNNLAFNNLTSFIISFIPLVILYLIYKDERVKYVIISFIIYPLSIIIKSIDIYSVKSILNLFIWMIPITLFSRKVFKLDNTISTIIEGVILPLMFIIFIFNVSLPVGLTLGIL